MLSPPRVLDGVIRHIVRRKTQRKMLLSRHDVTIGYKKIPPMSWGVTPAIIRLLSSTQVTSHTVNQPSIIFHCICKVHNYFMTPHVLYWGQDKIPLAECAFGMCHTKSPRVASYKRKHEGFGGPRDMLSYKGG